MVYIRVKLERVSGTLSMCTVKKERKNRSNGVLSLKVFDEKLSQIRQNICALIFDNLYTYIITDILGKSRHSLTDFSLIRIISKEISYISILHVSELIGSDTFRDHDREVLKSKLENMYRRRLEGKLAMF
jgi:hypothetical protein